MPASSKRALILEAAARIVETSGAGHLTMDAVAAAASVSKGGVLYHFPSKQALLEGMLERRLEEMTASTAAFRESRMDQSNAALIAHILEQHNQSLAQRTMQRAILAAAAEDPELLAPARSFTSRTFDDAGEGSAPPEMGWVLLLAAEGLRFLEMLNLLPLSAEERERVHERLLELAREHAA